MDPSKHTRAQTTQNLDAGLMTPLFQPDNPWESEPGVRRRAMTERSPLLPQPASTPNSSKSKSPIRGDNEDGHQQRRRLAKDKIWDRHVLLQRAAYYIPGLEWIPNYSLNQLAGDFLSGITVACILIPQSISYATSLAKLSPLSGLFSASVPGLFYAILGSSKHLNVAPEAALSLLIGQAVTAVFHADPHPPQDDLGVAAVAITTIICFQEGVFSFCLGFFRLGFIDVLLSRALLRGFVTAIAFVIMIEQLIPMLGLTAVEAALPHPLHHALDKLAFVISHISQSHVPTSVVAFTSLIILVICKYLKVWLRKKGGMWNKVIYFPEIFLVVVISTILSGVYRWDKLDISILGKITVKSHHSISSFVEFPINAKTRRWFSQTTTTAMLVSLVGYLDSVVAAKQNADRFGYSVSSNTEWRALGLANVSASLIPGTLPAYGSITRSKLNADIGGTSQMASVVCSTLILAATFWLLPVLEFLPKCVLSSIVFMVVISLLSEVPHDVGYYWRMRSYTDLLLMALTCVLTIVWEIEGGVMVSFVISLLLVVHRASKVRISILGRVPGTNKWKPINEDAEAEEPPMGILVIRIRENLDFANTAQLKERLRRIELFGHEAHHPSEPPLRSQARIFGFHLSDVETIDASAIQIFYELIQSYKSTRKADVFLTQVQPSVYQAFKTAGVIDLVGDDRVFDSLQKAIDILEVVDGPQPY